MTRIMEIEGKVAVRDLFGVIRFPLDKDKNRISFDSVGPDEVFDLVRNMPNGFEQQNPGD